MASDIKNPYLQFTQKEREPEDERQKPENPYAQFADPAEDAGDPVAELRARDAGDPVIVLGDSTGPVARETPRRPEDPGIIADALTAFRGLFGGDDTEPTRRTPTVREMADSLVAPRPAARSSTAVTPRAGARISVETAEAERENARAAAEQDELDQLQASMSTGERFQEAAKAFAQSVGGMGSSMVASIPVFAESIDQRLRSTPIGSLAKPALELPFRIAGEAAEALGLENPYQDVSFLDMSREDQEALVDAALQIREFAQEAFPTDPQLQDAFLESVLPRALGSAATFIGITALGSAAGGPAGGLTAGGLAGSSAGAGSQYLSALREASDAEGAIDFARVSDEELTTAITAGQGGALVGATEVVPIFRALDRAGVASGLLSRAKQALASGLIGTAEEAIQEGLSQVGHNAVAKALYDEDRQLGAGFTESIEAGGATGFLINVALSALPGRQTTAAQAYVDELSRLEREYGGVVGRATLEERQNLEELARQAAEETGAGDEATEGVRGEFDTRRDRRAEREERARREVFGEGRRPDATAQGAPAVTDENVGLYPVEDIQSDPKRFQFKSDVDPETGAGGELEDVKKFDENLAGVILVWRDPADGEVYVVNGHHRLEIASRFGVEDMLVRFLDVETASEARQIGALTNIAEGRGTAVDAAKLFREGDMNAEDIAERGVSLKGQLAAQGLALSNLPQKLFDDVVAKRLSVPRGAIIGGSGLTEEQQLSLSQLLQRKEASGNRLTNAQVAELIRFTEGAGTERVETTDLFGERSVDESLAVEKAELSAYVKKRLASDRRLFGYVTKGSRAERIEGAGAGRIERTRATEAAEQAAQAEEVYNRLSTRSGPVSGALNDAARALKRGEGTATEVKQELYQTVREGMRDFIGEQTGREMQIAAFAPDQPDMFGGAPAPAADETQGELLDVPEAMSSPKASEAEVGARQIVSVLEGKVRRDAATVAELERYNNAKRLLNRARAQTAEEIVDDLRARGEQAEADRDSGDLFAFRQSESESGSGRSEGSLESLRPRSRIQPGLTPSPNSSTPRTPFSRGRTAYRSPSTSNTPTTSGIDSRIRAFSASESAMEPPSFGGGNTGNIRDPEQARKFPGLAETAEGRWRLRLRNRTLRRVGAELDVQDKSWRQPVDNAEELYDRSEAAHGEYIQQVEAWGRTAGENFVRVIDPGLKPRESFLNKIGRKDKKAKKLGEPVTARIVGDVLRSTIMVENLAAARHVIAEIRADGAIVELDDFNANPTLFGYGAYHLQVRLPDGLLAEVQLTTPRLWQARKAFGGHDIYDKYEKVDPAGIAREQYLALLDDVEYARRTYSDAMEEQLAGVGPRNIDHRMDYDFDREVWTIENASGEVVATDGELATEARQLLTEIEGEGAGPNVEGAARATTPLQPGWKPKDRPGLQASESMTDAGPFQVGTASEAPGRMDIVKKMQRAFAEHFDQPLKIAEGGMDRTLARLGALAQYDPKTGVARSGSIGDVTSIAHEAGHHVQQLFFGDVSQDVLRQLPAAAQAELAVLGEGISGGGLAEGWAEFWRRWIDNPEALSRAPDLTRYIEGRLAAEYPAALTVLEQARDDWELHRTASPEARVDSHISTEAEPRNLSIRDASDRVKTDVIDDLHPVKLAVEAMARGEPVNFSEDAYSLARLVRGSVQAAESMLQEGTFHFHGRGRKGASFKGALAPVAGRLDQLRRYLVARRTLELHEREIEPGIRIQDARDVVEKYADDAAIQQAAEAVDTYQRDLLEYLRDSGVISQEGFERITEVSKNYVPFYRVMDQEGGGPIGGFGERFAHLFNPVKRIKGSGREIIDPLESIIRNTYMYTHLAHKQMVSTALGNLAEREGVGSVIEQLATPVRPQAFRLREIKQQLGQIIGEDAVEAMEAGARERLPARTLQATAREAPTPPEDVFDELLAVFRPGDYFGQPNTISVLRDGKRTFYDVHPELWRALEGLDRESLQWGVSVLAKPAASLRAGATLAPQFFVRNLIRDQLQAYVQSENGYKPFYDWVRGFIDLVLGTENARLWRASGGGGAALVDMDRKGLARKVDQLARSGGVENVIKHPVEALRAMSALFENATRVSEYRRARAAGKTNLEAAFAAREISTDFSKHGAKTQALRHIAAFWNARVQGYARLAEAFQKDPKGTTLRAFTAITLPSLLLYWVNRDDEEWWEQPQWQRDLFWMVKIGDQWVRIPKPFELGLVFGTLPERVVAWRDAQDPVGVRKFFTETLKKEAEGFIPIPTAIQPLLENVVNYSFFLERPIVPRGQQRVRPEFQYGEHTSEVAKGMARWFGDIPGAGVVGLNSPRKIDNLLSSWTGGLGRLGTEAVDVGVGLATEPARTVDELGAVDLADAPLTRGLTAREPGFNAESVARLYERLAEATSAKRTVSFLQNELRPEELQEFLTPEVAELMALEPLYREAADALAELRATRALIRRDPDMSAEEKERQIERLGQAATDIARGVIGREVPTGSEPESEPDFVPIEQ